MRVGILILSHGRADNVKTWALLDKRRSNLERKIVVDDEDEQLDEYRKRFGDNVIVFSKSNYMAKSDTFAPRSDRPRGIVLPARNACPDIAAALGWDYFIELDDDYDNIDTRYIDGGKLKSRNLENVDDAFTEMAKFLEKSGTDVIALAQGGDFIGGAKSTGATTVFMRKMMNVYCFRTSTDIRFYGYLNEDLTASVVHGMRGDLILTYTKKEIHQTKTQEAKGGLTEEYCRNGTYAKSMCSAIAAPSCVSIRMMGDGHYRMHHNVRWRNAAVKVIRGAWKKQ